MCKHASVLQIAQQDPNLQKRKKKELPCELCKEATLRRQFNLWISEIQTMLLNNSESCL